MSANPSFFRASPVVCACLYLLALFCQNSWATSTILDSWRSYYPDSKSADIRCQLCHLRRDGGSPWNAYGRDIRTTFFNLDPNTRTIEEAFDLVESLNSDADIQSVNNLDEIGTNEQPGWREGQVNFAYNRDNIEEGPYFPPVTIDPYPVKLPVIEYPLVLAEVTGGLTSPVAGAVAPQPSLKGQLFVADQTGVVWRVDLQSGAKSQYLTVQNRLVSLGAFEPGGYDERGLLGLAFHPQFSANGLLYLYLSEPTNTGTPDFTTLSGEQTANHQSVVLELTIANTNEAVAAATISSQREILRIDQPQFNHNGGDLQFDAQGLLYVALGDGGSADDQGIGHGDGGNGSDPGNPLGAILRIDPQGNNSINGKYGIPTDNPFIGQAERLDEIYAYGFRNPWKLSFDTNGKLYVADVGQNDIEEINQVNKGMHYGWRFREGSFFFDPNGEFSGLVTRQFPDNLPAENLIDPLFEYDHDEGISVSGGHVYRGDLHSSLRGKFVFADFSKRLFIGDINSGSVEALNLTPDIFIFSIARDADGELYLMGNTDARPSGNTGKIYKLESTLPPSNDELCLSIKGKNDKYGFICL